MFVLACLAVTGLILAMSSEGIYKSSSYVSAVTDNGGSAEQFLKRLVARNKQTVGITRSMMSISIGIEDASSHVKLNFCPFRHWWNSSNRVFHLGNFFLSMGEWESIFRLGRRIQRACFRSNGRRVIPEWVTKFLFRYNFHLIPRSENVIGSSITDVLDEYVQVPDVKTCRGFTRDCLKQLWLSTMNHDWPVLGFKMPFRQQISPYSYAQITYSTYGNKAQKNQFELFSTAQGFPVSPKGVLLLLGGFLGGFVGFTALFACLFLDGNRKEMAGSISLILCSIVVFHIGLFFLLK